jgi:hypothetical protein
MTRLAERLGYLWQRYVAWRSPAIGEALKAGPPKATAGSPTWP